MDAVTCLQSTQKKRRDGLWGNMGSYLPSKRNTLVIFVLRSEVYIADVNSHCVPMMQWRCHHELGWKVCEGDEVTSDV